MKNELCINNSLTMPTVIGVSGGSGSGKTTFVKELIKECTECTIVQTDWFYNSVPTDECDHNYDEPNAIDIELFIDTVNRLKNNETVECPMYNFETHQRETQTLTVAPSKVIIVEGIFVMYINKMCPDLIDIKIYIELDSDIALSRRLQRDIKERGRDTLSVLHQYETQVKKGHMSYVLPYRNDADIIIPNVQCHKRGLDCVIVYLKYKFL
jgi:uridine kinase